MGVGFMGAGAANASDIAAFRKVLAKLRSALEENGRDPATFPISKRVYLAIDDDRESANRKIQQWFLDHYRSAELGMKVSLIGSVDEIVDKLGPLAEEGLDMIMFNPVYNLIEHAPGNRRTGCPPALATPVTSPYCARILNACYHLRCLIHAQYQETADMQTLAQLLDAGAPDKAAVVTPNGPTLTYRQLRDQVEELASTLSAAGLSKWSGRFNNPGQRHPVRRYLPCSGPAGSGRRPPQPQLHRRRVSFLHGRRRRFTGHTPAGRASGAGSSPCSSDSSVSRPMTRVTGQSA